MVIEIAKNASADDIRKALKTIRRKKTVKSKSIASFFGKLPKIKDGLGFQKTARNEWE